MWTRLRSRASRWLAAVRRGPQAGASEASRGNGGRAGTALFAAPAARIESIRPRLRTSYASITIRLPYRGMPAVPSGDHAHPWLRIERLVRQFDKRVRTEESRRQLKPLLSKLRAERRRIRAMGWFN
jgi:hypothetical protein